MAFGAFDNQITRMIPEGTGARITEQAQATDAVMEQIFSGGTGNPFALGLDALRSALDDDRRPWVHYGATTQDILDTARGLQIRDSLDLIDDCTDKLLTRIRDLAGVHAKTLMVARTNGQHAVPTTLGMRFARWAADLERSRDRLTETRQRCLLVQFSGAAGTYASMGEHGTTVAMGVAKELGLVCELIAWHASRDGLTELACNLAIHAQTLAKIAEDLYDMQRTDFQEAAEPLDPHLSGSSTMPQKRNPFSTMKITAAARLAAGAAATVLTNPPGDFERDHRQLEVERDAIPRILAAVDGAGQKLLKLLDVLEFNTGQLDVNARREGVLLVSEGIMMELASRLGHEGAHDLLQEFSAAYRAAGTSLRDQRSPKNSMTSTLTSCPTRRRTLVCLRNYHGVLLLVSRTLEPVSQSDEDSQLVEEPLHPLDPRAFHLWVRRGQGSHQRLQQDEIAGPGAESRRGFR